MSYDDDPSGPFITLHFALSKLGQRDALRQGHDVDERQTFLIDSDDPDWERAFALEPEISGPRSADLALAVWRVETFNPERSFEYLTVGPSFEVVELWRRPYAAIAYGDQLVPLDTFPTASTLLDQIEASRTAAEAALQREDAEVKRLQRSWRQWVPQFLDHCSVQLSRWQTSPAIAELRSPVRQFGVLEVLANKIQIAQDADESATTANRIDAVITALLEAGNIVGQAELDFARVQARRIELTEACDWVSVHGSGRLQKAMRLGLLDSSLGAYRDERLAAEHPGWRWASDGAKWRSIVNPAEQILDALAEAREWDPKAALLWEENDDFTGAAVRASFLGRMIVRRQPKPKRPPVPDVPAGFDDAEEPF